LLDVDPSTVKTLISAEWICTILSRDCIIEGYVTRKGATVLEVFDKAVDNLRKLPGIGKKSARRLVFHLLNVSRAEVENLAESLLKAKDQLGYCKKCFGLAEADLCEICSDPGRSSRQLCVVAQPETVFRLEASGEFEGLYHVLRGLISPLDGVGPEQLTIKDLINRIETEKDIEEIIFAFNPTNEGEVTMNYLKKLLADYEVKLTHLGYGLPVGSDLEYTDRLTLNKAFENRVNLAGESPPG